MVCSDGKDLPTGERYKHEIERNRDAFAAAPAGGLPNSSVTKSEGEDSKTEVLGTAPVMHMTTDYEFSSFELVAYRIARAGNRGRFVASALVL